MKKCLLDAIVAVLHIYQRFLLEKQILKSPKWVRPRDVYGDKLWDVPGTSAGSRSYKFKFSSEAY